MSRPRWQTRTHTTRAFVLKRTSTGESDLILQLFTEDLGRVAAVARAARKSYKRFGGTLEPFHTLRLRLDERVHSDLFVLREGSMEAPRPALMTNLELMEAAGQVLGWVRMGSPQKTREPSVWETVTALLDALEQGVGDPKGRMVETGLHLIRCFGWGIDLDACVGCGKPCTPGRAAYLGTARGGLVCRQCGGAPRRLSGAERERLSRAARGEHGVLVASDFEVALAITTETLRLHAETP